jgi:hypothetical protein
MKYKHCPFRIKDGGEELLCTADDSVECEYKADFQIEYFLCGVTTSYYPCYANNTEGFRKAMRD